jgi:hypothetical protein
MFSSIMKRLSRTALDSSRLSLDGMLKQRVETWLPWDVLKPEISRSSSRGIEILLLSDAFVPRQITLLPSGNIGIYECPTKPPENCMLVTDNLTNIEKKRTESCEAYGLMSGK